MKRIKATLDKADREHIIEHLLKHLGNSWDDRQERHRVKELADADLLKEFQEHFPKEAKEIGADCFGPKDEPEVPMKLRNPYGSSFLQRIAMRYQVIPDGHPYNAAEKLQIFTPESLRHVEDATLLPEETKVQVIRQRDKRWDRGVS